ncbi:MAG: enoyl-CoA hydratase-related protein [Rhodospirillales bacterium]
MVSPGCSVDITDGVATITMSDPKKKNALSKPVVADLEKHIDGAMTDPNVRAVILTGAGGIFSSGGDISSFDTDEIPLRRRMPRLQRICSKIAHSEKPVIAAVEGGAFGGGLSLALLADQIISADDARFCASFVKIGLVPDLGLLSTLPARVGVGRAKEIMMLGEDVSAAEALEDGLVDELTPPGQALSRAKALAQEFASMAPLALAYTKATVMRWPMTLSQELAWEAQAQGLLFTTNDLQEGRKAFFEKRKPAFAGN